MQKKITLFFLCYALPLLVSAQSAAFWSPLSESELPKSDKRYIRPLRYEAMRLDFANIKRYLADAPLEGSRQTPLMIDLPAPDGTMQRFALVESPIMEAGLAAQLPEIKTFVGQGITDPTATLRLDVTYKGLHAQIIGSNDQIFIDPYHLDTQTEYIVYYKRFFVSSKAFHCGVEADELTQVENFYTPEQVGEQLRTYRIAVACTGEYAQFHGGNINAVASAIVTTMNRVNGIYERELASRMILVANNNALIFLNASTDPFDNDNTGTLIAQGQNEITSIIGTSNFDIGHVFSTGAGGLAGLGVICRNNNKGRGVTGIAQPVGDPFDVDYVAHEIGHQFGGNHTFNGSTGSCLSNRANSAAYEPGSGTTIMAYAGICTGQNVQNNSSDYFHTHSFDEIITYTTQGTGNSCPVTTNTGNDAPIVTAGTGGFFIPKSTPFELVGTATDPDGDALTFCWEQYDRGPQGAPNAPQGNAPLFRSFSPVPVPSRTFPQISDIVNNTQTLGEILPTYSRPLTFRLTARDNKAAGGGVTYDVINFLVEDAAGPFLVTEPNTAQTVWTEGGIANVTWDMAGTDLAPVNCTIVDILLSVDGGYTYPFVLATAVPNNGSATVLVPQGSATTQARVKVQAADNIFFDISNQNFTIQAPTVPDYVVFNLDEERTVCGGTDAGFSFLLLSLLNYNDPINLTATGLPTGVNLTFSSNPATAGDTVFIAVTNTENAPTGLYNIVVQTNSASSNKTLDFDLTIYAETPPTVQLIAPLNGENAASTFPLLRWAAPGGAAHTYDVQLSTKPDFSVLLASANDLTATNFAVTNLAPYTVYYWRVRAKNPCAEGEWSAAAAFRTATLVCETFTGGQQRTIIGGVVFTYNSDLNVTKNVEITKINVKGAVLTHQRISDISLQLRSPSGTLLDLMPQTCANLTGTSNWTLNFDDAALATVPNCSNNLNATLKPTDPLATFSGENAQGTWQMRITDNAVGQGGTFSTYGLEICYAEENNNADPVIVNNDTLKVAVGGTKSLENAQLLATDADNPSESLIFTLIENTKKGELLLNGNALNLGATFTQGDINAGRLSYKHLGNAPEIDTFRFDVRDGFGGWVGTPNFVIQTTEANFLVTEQNPLIVYPNPATEFLNLEFFLATPQTVKIRIFDAIGREVGSYEKSGLQGANFVQIVTQSFAAGTYIVLFESPDLTKTVKIITLNK